MTDQEQKPKRVLTEAQRLAFLKGREKRLANLERRRLEKMEAMTTPVQPSVEPANEPDAPVGIDKPQSTSPDVVESKPAAQPTTAFDMDAFAKRVADHLSEKVLVPQPKPKRPYMRKTITNTSSAPTTPPRPAPAPAPAQTVRPTTLWL